MVAGGRGGRGKTELDGEYNIDATYYSFVLITVVFCLFIYFFLKKIIFTTVRASAINSARARRVIRRDEQVPYKILRSTRRIFCRQNNVIKKKKNNRWQYVLYRFGWNVNRLIYQSGTRDTMCIIIRLRLSSRSRGC